MRLLRPCVILVLLSQLFPSLSHAAGGPGHAGPAFSLRTEPDGWTLRYTPIRISSSALSVEGVPHIMYTSAPAGAGADSGAPQLPVETVSLGIPFGASVTVEITDPVYEESQNQLVAPVPRYRRTANGEHEAVYIKDNSAYTADRFYPSRTVWTDPPFVFRQQRIVTIHLAPVLYNPARKTLRRLVSGSLRIRTKPAGLTGTFSPGTGAGRADTYLESTYRSLLLNYDQARGWRTPGTRPAAQQADSSRTWFTPGNSYYLIPVVADGWYRLTKGDIATAGGAQFDTATAALWYRGRRIPVTIGPDSSVEFYALRNHGDSTYYDYYTDTSSYWLTWGGSPGARFGVAAPSGAPMSANVTSAFTTLHMEENHSLYQGTDESELTNSGPVPGKGWVWENYFPGNQYSHTFTVDSVDQTPGTATARVRLYSTTPHYTTPDHIARFWLNDSLLGVVSFNGRTEGMFTATFPSRWLINGTNQIRILSDVPSGGTVNQFYLDWFEIGYPRLLRAAGDQLVFTGPPASGGGNAGFTVTGFQNPSIAVYDVNNGRRIGGGTVSGSPAAGYAVAFQDTFSSARTYAVVSPSGAMSVLPLSQRVFSDIRTNPSGADYIIITHRQFLTAARQLAAFRRSTSGLRITVVDVQDIYDQFNYGMLNVDPIKAFLRYASSSWMAPSPSYLVMFGDASWDFHRYMPTTVKTNFVPAYGVPGGDNWYACFDSVNAFIPSMMIGRLPVQDSVQAGKVVAKITGYESSVPAEWTKSFLFIAGGTTPSEQADFNSRNNFTVNTYVTAPPVGGFAYSVYKTTPDAIDGEHRQQLEDIVNEGVVYVNFLGHSGGRIWGVDIGSPDALQNTNGRLPFVSSVSCNVGAFSEPSSNVLSEDFVLADNRGAVAFWASASLAYASVGSALVNNFFNGVTVDSVRDFGALTTAARLRLWQTSGSNYITIGSVNLTPLLGDPLSHFALPLKPDLAVSPGDLYLSSSSPAAVDSVLTLTALVHNYGLVPADSVTVLLTDVYNGQATPLLNNTKIGRTRFRDSLAVPWRGTKQIGVHTFQMNIDPAGLISEVTKTNNVASTNVNVYANLLYVVRPLQNMIVPLGPQLLRVTSPIGVDSAAMQVMFQLDTSVTFSSPFLLTSQAVVPGPVSAEWTTPPLVDGTLYYWRARSFTSSINNAWVASTFRTSAQAPASPLVRWSESSSGQFAGGTASGTSVTDSGITISAQVPSRVYARSLGNRADANKDYYSIVQLDNQTMFGLWWEQGNGFLALRVDPLSRSPVFHAFDVPGQTAQSDSMQNFIAATSPGYFLAFSVIHDGRTNVTPGLRNALKALGSTLIDSVQPGDAWSMIAEVGGGMSPLEHWSAAGVTADSLLLQNAYSAGSGTFAGTLLPMPQRWQTFRWASSGAAGPANARVAIVGIRSNGVNDTLRVLPRDSTIADITGLNALTADPSYISFRAVTLLTSPDGRSTPVMRNWSADFEPAADLAISSHTLSAPKIRLMKGTAGSVTLSVYNIGYRKADSARVVLSYVQPDNALRPIAYAMVDSIPAGGKQTVQLAFPTIGLPSQFAIQARVAPAAPSKELIWENNVTLFNFTVQPGVPLSAKIRILADGVQLMDGDYLGAKPKIAVQLYDLGGVGSVPPAVDLYVDNIPITTPAAGLAGTAGAAFAHPSGDPTFTPSLSNGNHELRIRASQVNDAGGLDTVVQQMAINVTDQYKILQMYNYPDPFKNETWFTFVLTGNTPPDELTIRIYTVKGRKIRELKAAPGTLEVGFNRVHWDGRDAEGDEIANGYYLYQVQISAGGKSLTSTGKLARVR